MGAVFRGGAGEAERLFRRLPGVSGQRQDRARGGVGGGAHLPGGGLSQPGHADQDRRAAGPGGSGVPQVDEQKFINNLKL